MQTPYKILILGGYGNFGARIARRLAQHPHIQLIIAGRDLVQAQKFARQLGGAAMATALNIHAPDFDASLQKLGADLVIHTAGPFQQQNYNIPLAVARAGANYIDLADGRQFVCEFPQTLHTIFTNAGKLAITGASTVPALSSAVVNALSADMQKVEEIDICIAPAQQAPRGIATMKAVLSYCGEPIPILRNGQWTHDYGWLELAKIKFARMPSRLGALCDIPDLALFPQHYTGVKTVMFRAALELGLSQRFFAALAYLKRRSLLPHLERLAGVINLIAKPFDYLGSKLGGMVVKVKGVDANGKIVSREWHIAAHDNHGPEIPCMAAILLARKLADQEIHQSGAYCCLGLLTLQEFESEFRIWNMQTDVISDA